MSRARLDSEEVETEATGKGEKKRRDGGEKEERDRREIGEGRRG